MSVYIKGMEMPTGCVKCLLNSDSKCLIMQSAGYDETNGSERRHDCPLVPVPPHGRVIDADALAEMLEKYKKEYALNAKENIVHLHKAWGLFEAELMAESLPTIIPADHIGDVNEMVADKEGE